MRDAGAVPGLGDGRDGAALRGRLRRRCSSASRSSPASSSGPCSSSAAGCCSPARPTGRATCKTIGLVFALAGALVFAFRDTFVRWLAVDADVAPELAISATLSPVASRSFSHWSSAAPGSAWASFPHFLPAGLCSASPTSRCTRRSSAAASASWRRSSRPSRSGAWGSRAVFLRRTEGVGRRLVLGALLVVAGGILIGVFR